MIIFGWATAALILNQYPSLLACPTCRQPRFFNIALIYSRFSLFYVFGIVYERHHTLRCSICQHEPDMLPLDIEQQARPASIPLAPPLRPGAVCRRRQRAVFLG